MKIIKAARGGITGHFGDKNVPGANVKSHGGMDIGHGNKTDADLRVVAPAAGRVIFAGKSGTYGLCIIIDHGNGYTSLLAHLADVLVHVGFEVDQGQSIAGMGNSGGNWPVHLHQELRLHDVQLDPEKYLAGTAGGGITPLEENELDTNQAAQLRAAHENAAEARRVAAVIVGGAEPVTAAEKQYIAVQEGLFENVAETRRMLAVLLGVQPPAGAERVPRVL